MPAIYLVSTTVPIAARADQLNTTARSVLSQNAPAGWELRWHLRLAAGAGPRLGATAEHLRIDPRVRIQDGIAGEHLGAAENANIAAAHGEGSEVGLVRFVQCGDELLPDAVAGDIRSTTAGDAAWCASPALDAIAGEEYHPDTPAPEPGWIALGAVLDGWARPNADLQVHPLTAAFRPRALREAGGLEGAMGYAVYTDLLARVNDLHPGVFRRRPSLVLAPAEANPQDRRTPEFHAYRLERTAQLLRARDPQPAPASPTSGDSLWLEVAARAWSAVDEGHARTPAPDDDLQAVLLQARKYHYRFDWARLARYGAAALGRFPDDDYLRAMTLTATAAIEQSWDRALAFCGRHPNTKIRHLLLTAMFLQGLDVPAGSLAEGVQIAATLYDDCTGADRVVAAYRCVSLQRMLGNFDLARRWAATATTALGEITDDPRFVEHIRERLVIEGAAINVPRTEG